MRDVLIAISADFLYFQIIRFPYFQRYGILEILQMCKLENCGNINAKRHA